MSYMLNAIYGSICTTLCIYRYICLPMSAYACAFMHPGNDFKVNPAVDSGLGVSGFWGVWARPLAPTTPRFSLTWISNTRITAMFFLGCVMTIHLSTRTEEYSGLGPWCALKLLQVRQPLLLSHYPSNRSILMWKLMVSHDCWSPKSAWNQFPIRETQRLQRHLL